MEQTVELILTFTQKMEGDQISKNINVSGSALRDKYMCYAMLEGARDAIKDHHDKQGESNIIQARMVPVGGNGQ